MIFLAAVLALAAGHHELAEDGQRRLARCAGGAAVLRGFVVPDWHDQPSSIADHVSLRQELGVTVPEGRSRVLIFVGGGHLVTVQQSTVATRETDGWMIDEVSATRSWADVVAPLQPGPHLRRRLGVAQAQRLDAILADPCLYAEPTEDREPRTTTPVVATLTRRIEVSTPDRRRVAIVSGPAYGLTAEMENIVTGAN